jgi:CBS-domain-containing membrane protein
MTYRTVQDVMTRDVVTVEETTPYKTVADLLAVRQISAVPVIDADGRVAGVASEADLLHKVEFEGGTETGSFFERRHQRQGRAKAAGSSASDVMTSPAVTITPDAPAAVAARLMDRRKVKRLPVVDSGGRLVGIVSRRDLLRVFLQADDVIRAEVVDDVFHRVLWIGPPHVSVEVQDGVVTLVGELEQRSLVEIAVRLTAAVGGVVGVVNRLSYRLDDRRLDVPSPLP